jgi:two-component system, chemotaxis family, sensor kinase CheA
VIDVDRDGIVQVFIAEAEERLGRMEEALLALEGSPDDPDLLAGIFRDAHTLKGNAVSLGFTDMADLAHALEDLLDRARQGAVALGPDRVAALLRQIDALRDALEGVTSGAAQAAPDRARTATTPPAPAAERRTLRVDVAKLDRLMDLASEIAIARGRVQQLLEVEGSAQALAAHRDSDRSFLDLQELILRARMVSVGPAFRAYARTVRDVAEAHGKQARLVVDGGDVEVDTSIIEHLRDALTHLVRNAIDHGIEPPARRAARGKDPCGTVCLRAFREAGNIVVELSDDGGGLDRARIAERARARGRTVATERASDADLQRLIFEPGFSTADKVTELSGRGVGMDVVRRNVEALRGSVTVASREGQGTTFCIRLPLTLAIIDGFGTVAGGETYVVPTEAVIECLELPRTAEASGGGRTVINLRGEPLPCLRLRDHFALSGGDAARENVVVVRHEGGRAGLVVDALLGERQTVIKPLGPLFRALPGIAGSAILGSGRVALILDVPGLLRQTLAPDAVLFQEASSAS